MRKLPKEAGNRIAGSVSLVVKSFTAIEWGKGRKVASKIGLGFR